MILKTRLLNIVVMSAIFYTFTASSVPEDILRDFLERDAAISRGVIEKPGRAEASRSERDGLIADINGRLAGEGYQLGWTQNFGLDRDLSERNGWRIHQGQDFAYDLETIMVSGKGFIAARTFESALFGDGPIIVGGSYSSINRELAVRLNIIHEKTFIGPAVTRGWNTQVSRAPVEGPEITVQFLNGAYQPLKVCAQILSAAILVPITYDTIANHGATCRLILEYAQAHLEKINNEIILPCGQSIFAFDKNITAMETAYQNGLITEFQLEQVKAIQPDYEAWKESARGRMSLEADVIALLISGQLKLLPNTLPASPEQVKYLLDENGML